MPFCVEVVHVQSTSTATKDSEKGMVPHMPDSAAQRCAFETTFCSGALDGHLAAANRNTRQQQTPHDLPFPLSQLLSLTFRAAERIQRHGEYRKKYS